ncbi:D-alanine--D-alanyl carrier protein ligase [Streptomyces alboniger]
MIRGKDIAATARSATVLIATPTVLSGVDPASCPRVRTVAVAGEPCPRPLADRWARRAAFFNCCGPTETTIVNTMSRHDPAAPLLTIGRPTPNNTVYVLDADRRPLPVGEVGEMWAGGDCVSAGYLGDDRLNAERYAPDPFCGGDHRMFRTRDLGRWTPDGELEHLGPGGGRGRHRLGAGLRGAVPTSKETGAEDGAGDGDGGLLRRLGGVRGTADAEDRRRQRARSGRRL